MRDKTLNFLETPARRKVLFAALYASEGAPIGYLWWALPTRLKSAGVAEDDIGQLAALLALPWALKVLWAPLIDVLRGSRWGRRAWILSAQLLMGLALLPLIHLDLKDDFHLVVIVVLVHAFAAATQDVAIDSLAIAATPASERGSINAWMQVGMLSTRAAFAGGTLILAQHVGDAAIVIALAGTIWISSALLLGSRINETQESADRSWRESARQFRSTLASMLWRKVTWLGLALALLAGTCFEGVAVMLGPFLRSRGVSETQIGGFYLAPAVGAAMCGAFIGGRLSDRIGRARTVGIAVIACVMTVLLIAGSDLLFSTLLPGVRFALLTLLYLEIGIFTAASYALFMDLTDPRLGATQFSAYMGTTNLCEAMSAYAVGRLTVLPQLGYPGAFVLTSLVSLTCLPLLRRLEGTYELQKQNDLRR